MASHLVDALIECGSRVVGIDRKSRPDWYHHDAEYLQADLTVREECARLFRGVDMVFHLAAVGWGFHENLKQQPRILTENLLLNTTVLDAAYQCGVDRYLFTSSVAVYPGDLDVLDEDVALDSPPNKSEAGYAWSKRMGEIQAVSFFTDYGFPVSIARLSNPYGPRDEFDPEKSHVIPSLLRRAAGREDPFIIWGTGKPVRAFIFAEDAAAAMMKVMEKMPNARPVNIAAPETVTIAELVDIVLEVTGHSSAKKVYDTTKPDGHPGRMVSARRLIEEVGMKDFTPLEKGLQKTVEWYLQNKSLVS